MRDETKCLHAGYTPKNKEPRVVPIVQSTTYVYDSTEDVAAVFDDPMKSLLNICDAGDISSRAAPLSPRMGKGAGGKGVDRLPPSHSIQ